MKDGIDLTSRNFDGGEKAAEPCHVESVLNKDFGAFGSSIPRTKPSPRAPCGVSKEGGKEVGALCKMCANGET